MCPIPLVHKHIQIIQVAATPLQRGVEGGEQWVRVGMCWRRKNGRITGGGGCGGARLCLSRALLYKAISSRDWVCVVASAMPVLRFVPVIRVFTFTCVSLPLSLPLPSPLLVLLIFPVVAIPPFSSIALPPSWKLRKNEMIRGEDEVLLLLLPNNVRK